MKRRIGLTLGVLLAGCASAPPVHFWSLQQASPPTSAAGSHCVIQLGPVAVPDAYDRADIVVTDGAQRITWSSSEQWEAPLPGVLAGRLAAGLRQGMGSETVYVSPTILSDVPDYLVQIQFQQIRATLGDGVTLKALWTIKPAEGKTLSNGGTVHHAVAGGGFEALVAATGENTDEIAAAIARDIQRVGGCPAKQP